MTDVEVLNQCEYAKMPHILDDVITIYGVNCVEIHLKRSCLGKIFINIYYRVIQSSWSAVEV